jgi:endonuclease-3
VSKRLGLIEKTQEQVVEIRNTLEHLIPKAKGVEFTDLISTVGVQYCHENKPNCAACPLAKECQFASENAKPASKKPAVAIKKTK